MLDASHGYTLWRSLGRASSASGGALRSLQRAAGLGKTTKEQWRCWEQGYGEYAGMSGLVTTVGSTCARNVILLGGLGWEPTTPSGLKYSHPTATSTRSGIPRLLRPHPLCDESCWNKRCSHSQPVYPWLLMSSGDAVRRPASIAWLNQWMSYAASKGFSMLAWAWNFNMAADAPNQSSSRARKVPQAHTVQQSRPSMQHNLY